MLHNNSSNNKKKTSNMMSIIVIVLVMIVCGKSEREHKVHNIILYPEKHSWCQTTPIRQVVASSGYESITIDNNICVGACYSYSIPSTQPAEPGEIIRPYCDSCQPVDTKCYHVTLKADGKNTEGPRTFQKRVQIIMNCSCMSCEKIQNSNNNNNDDCSNVTLTNQQILELPSDLFANRTQQLPPVLTTSSSSSSSSSSSTTVKSIVGEDVPELLHFIPENKNRSTHHLLQKFKYDTNSNLTRVSTPSSSVVQRYELNAKLITFLKSIQENASSTSEDDMSFSYDKTQLKNLLKIIEGGEERELSDKNLMEFVNFVNIHNSDDLELDLGRLKEVLLNFQKSQKILLMERHRDFGLNNNNNNNGGQSSSSSDDFQSYKLPLSLDDISSSGSSSSSSVLPDAEIKTNLIINNNEENERVEGVADGTDVEVKHHHLGDEVPVHGMHVGHLVKGPHGSMVLAKVEEKFNIDSDVLKPNHDGVVIDYENHNKKRLITN